MDNRYIENVIKEIKPLLDEQGFKAKEENIFENDATLIKVDYDEARQMFLLLSSEKEEGKEQEYKELSAWLFDDSQNAKDAEAVGIDFADTLRKELGIKVKSVARTAEIELPTANKVGGTDVMSLTKKMLDIFPPLKAEYKNHMATYGNFLYLEFYGEFVVKDLKKMFKDGTQNQISKLYKVLKEVYIKGDKESINLVVAILAAAAYEDNYITERIKDMFKEDKHFKDSFENFLPVLSKNKKLKALLIKE